MSALRQLRLPLPATAGPARAPFAASPVNRVALAAVEAWPAWPGALLALVGPEGSGKSHLASLWQARAGAQTWDGQPLDTLTGPLLIEDADRLDGETLFHLINMAPNLGGLLLTARERPVSWPAALPDLRSRLNALTVAELAEPDDAVLAAMLENLFEASGIRPAADVYPYLLRRMERSAAAARAVVHALDEASAAERRDVNRALARELFEPANTDMFDDA
ncbi:chromosomal replication initiation ATPase DnaA [Caulobacter ginsengisoli]|uniref:Chromosomal replication initiation ATPase DnaA n=1 Tax=Caulobacter ginsengisoli TaxID=400775 RepID=A0ABU0IN70_9CAUL|nr:chromosomal replication initiator DnaA [Caulobacter ginsengisoli]MDQ0462841.1 chromosomal replication initiation ATPase DnaA [Caulobacter ginsengisoli]